MSEDRCTSVESRYCWLLLKSMEVRFSVLDSGDHIWIGGKT